MTQNIDFEQEKQIFDERGFIGPCTLFEPDVMRAWWKEQRIALMDAENQKKACFDNPMNYDRHLDIPGLSKLVQEPALVRRFQNLLGPDVLCWRTEFFP